MTRRIPLSVLLRRFRITILPSNANTSLQPITLDWPALFDTAQVHPISNSDQRGRPRSRRAHRSHGVVTTHEAHPARGSVHKPRGPDTVPALVPRLLQPYVATGGNPQRHWKRAATRALADAYSPGDIEALITGAKYVKALIPAVVNIVYKKLLQYDITARAFTTRSTSFEGPVDDVPDENSPQILHRKMFLRAYLNKLCSDPSRMDFWEYLDKVG